LLALVVVGQEEEELIGEETEDDRGRPRTIRDNSYADECEEIAVFAIRGMKKNPRHTIVQHWAFRKKALGYIANGCRNVIAVAVLCRYVGPRLDECSRKI